MQHSVPPGPQLEGWDGDARVSSPAIATDAGSDGVVQTVFVLRTASSHTACILNELIPRYNSQLSEAGIGLAVLHFGAADDYPVRLTGVSLSRRVEAAASVGTMTADVTQDRLFIPNTGTLPAGRPGSEVPICYVTWRSTLDDSPRGTFEGMNVHNFHDQNIVLWWRHCSSSFRSFDHAWFVEADAFFSGDVSKFMKEHEHLTHDVVATGFRIVGANWWKIRQGLYDLASSRGFSWNEFSTQSDVISNLHGLSTLRHGPCGDGTSDTKGAIFFQDHVMRISKRLLMVLGSNLDRGIIGPSESYIATTCASHFGFENGQTCSLYDFEPNLTLDWFKFSKTRWVAQNNYCWQRRGFPAIEGASRLHCLPVFKDRWIHKFNCARQKALSCE